VQGGIATRTTLKGSPSIIAQTIIASGDRLRARQFRSASADRNRFMALYIGIVIGLLVAACLFIYEARVVIEDGMRV
jgi:hypothetical protein